MSSEPLWFPEVAGEEAWDESEEKGLVKVCPRCFLQHIDSVAHQEECTGGTA